MILALWACGGGTGFLEDPSCAYNPHDWFDGVTLSVAQADEDDNFAFDPPGDPMVERVGSYDRVNGDFFWADTYDDGHYLVEATVKGYGTAYRNGDLDVAYTWSALDDLGAASGRDWRITRGGCVQTWRQTDTVSDASYTGVLEILSDDEVQAQLELVTSTTYELLESTYTSDLDRVYTHALEVTDQTTGLLYAETATGTERGSGTSDETWEATYGDLSAAGSRILYFNGNHQEAWTVQDSATGDLVESVDVFCNYDGSGSGSYVFASDSGEVVCTYEATAVGTCSLVCPTPYGEQACVPLCD